MSDDLIMAMSFGRKSSGLIKSLSKIDVFSINLLYMGILSGISYPVFVSELMKNVNFTFAVLLASVFEIPLLFMYYRLSSKIPINGGDYAYIRTAFGIKSASIFGVSLYLLYVFSAPVLSDLVLLNFNLSNVCRFLYSELIFMIALLSIAKKSIFTKVLDSLMILQILVSIVLPIFSLIYYQIFQVSRFDINNTILSALLFDLSEFLFINAISYFVGEIKNVNNSLKFGYFMSYIIVTILSLFDVYSNLEILLFLMPIWYFSYILVNQSIQTRLLQVMSFDNIMPSFMYKITPNVVISVFVIDSAINVVENLLNFNISFGFDGLLFIFWNFIIVTFAMYKLLKDKLLMFISLTSLTIQIFLFFYLGYSNVVFYNFVISTNLEFAIFKILLLPVIGIVVYLIRRKKLI